MKCMSSMERILLILVCLVKGLLETEAVSVTGEINGSVEITCSHSYAFSNIKYFCRGNCGYDDILITSRTRTTSNGKYSIRDEGNIFHVTISDLTMDDSGIYWCGIERTGVDTYTKVELTVKGIENEEVSSYESLVYISVVVGVVVFSLLILIILILRRRRRRIPTSSGKNLVANQSRQKPEEHRTTTSSSSANEDTGADVRSKIVLIQPEGLFYTSVSFNTHTECSSVTPPSDAVIYSNVAH